MNGCTIKLWEGHMIKKTWIATACASTLIFASVSFADEVTDLLQEAIEAYEQGDLTLVKENLAYTTQLLNQKSADSIAAALPEPFDGWAADDAEASSGAAGLFGGGVQASRTYTQGDSRVEISITGESPLMSQMLMIMSNPAMAGSMGKMIRIGKQRGIQSQDGDTVTLIFNNRLLITIEGRSSIEDKVAYAEAIDYDTLQKL